MDTGCRVRRRHESVSSAGVDHGPEFVDLGGEQGQGKFGGFDFRVPHLFPFVAEPAVVVGVSQEPHALRGGELAASKQHIVRVLVAFHWTGRPFDDSEGLRVLLPETRLQQTSGTHRGKRAAMMRAFDDHGESRSFGADSG